MLARSPPVELIGVSESNLIWLKNINFFEPNWSRSHLWDGGEKK